MGALERAIARAESGLDWSRPCLIWVADYLADATGRDPADEWRGVEWTEDIAKAKLARLAVGGAGETSVERALDAIAIRDGWEQRESARQGALMVGVYNAPDGVGVPAIFDGQRRWIYSNDGRGWTSTAQTPWRMWEVKCG